jgi:hypothetical protein
MDVALIAINAIQVIALAWIAARQYQNHKNDS